VLCELNTTRKCFVAQELDPSFVARIKPTDTRIFVDLRSSAFIRGSIQLRIRADEA